MHAVAPCAIPLTLAGLRILYVTLLALFVPITPLDLARRPMDAPEMKLVRVALGDLVSR